MFASYFFFGDLACHSDCEGAKPHPSQVPTKMFIFPESTTTGQRLHSTPFPSLLLMLSQGQHEDVNLDVISLHTDPRTCLTAFHLVRHPLHHFLWAWNQRVSLHTVLARCSLFIRLERTDSILFSLVQKVLMVFPHLLNLSFTSTHPHPSLQSPCASSTLRSLPSNILFLLVRLF